MRIRELPIRPITSALCRGGGEPLCGARDGSRPGATKPWPHTGSVRARCGATSATLCTITEMIRQHVAWVGAEASPILPLAAPPTPPSGGAGWRARSHCPPDAKRRPQWHL